jgi:hypothetical protein
LSALSHFLLQIIDSASKGTKFHGNFVPSKN